MRSNVRLFIPLEIIFINKTNFLAKVLFENFQFNLYSFDAHDSLLFFENNHIFSGSALFFYLKFSRKHKFCAVCGEIAKSQCLSLQTLKGCSSAIFWPTGVYVHSKFSSCTQL